MKSAAVVNYAPEKGSVEIREIETPTIGSEDVLLEVANVGVCGSDLHQWTADHSWPVNYPVVLGHEFGGRIVEVGKDVEGWKEGDRVVSETAAIISPNNPMTKRGLYNLDPTRKGFGQIVIGRMAEAAVEGEAEIVFRESGLSWHLSAPAENALAQTEPYSQTRQPHDGG